MHKRLISLALVALALAACALPQIGQQATPSPASATAQLAAEPTEATASRPTSAATSGSFIFPQETPQDIRTAVPAETLQPAGNQPTTDLPATALPATAALLDDPNRIAAAVPGDRDQVALAEAFLNVGDLPEVARTTPLEVEVGDVEEFWVSDAIEDTNYTITARLRYAGPVVLMYVDTEADAEINQADIERSARQFEEQIYPRNRELFGVELSPGVDGDPRLTILNTPVRGAGGYFSSADGVVKAVNRFSNEREMFVIGIDSYPIGNDAYASTLAHEFQHMIEWYQQRRSPSWLNEGMSTLAEDLNGFGDQGTAMLALGTPDIQLTTWSSDSAQTGSHYGTSQLFLRYFHEQYAGDQGLAELIKADAGNNPEAFVPIAARKRPEIKTFADIYADWAVANVVADSSLEDGRYNYQLLPATAQTQPVSPGAAENTTVSQFGTDYLEVLQGPATISFDGAETVSLVGAQPAEGSYMWWSNRGDDSIETLTRELDLTSVQKATLQFSAWYEIELDWDYAFVTVSSDEGKTWTTVEGRNTTNEDPQGVNYGNGITGVSGTPGVETDQGTDGTWVEEQMDLTPFVGKKVLLRIWVVNDAAYNAQGLLIDNIRIPELNYSDTIEAGEGGWQAQGFVRTTGTLPQQWTLRLVRRTGSTISVDPVPVDAEGRATVQVEAGSSAILVVIGSTPATTEAAQYSYSVK